MRPTPGNPTTFANSGTRKPRQPISSPSAPDVFADEPKRRRQENEQGERQTWRRVRPAELLCRAFYEISVGEGAETRKPNDEINRQRVSYRDEVS